MAYSGQNLNFQIKKYISSISEMLSNYSLFGGQLSRKSNHERTARVIYLRTTDRLTMNYYSKIYATELIRKNN